MYAAASKFGLTWLFEIPMIFPILKIPFILATTLALHVSVTPPNPPAPESERPTKVKTMMSDRLIGRAVQYFFPAMKVRELSSSAEVRD